MIRKALAVGIGILLVVLFMAIGWGGCPNVPQFGMSCKTYEDNLGLLGLVFDVLIAVGLVVTGIGLFMPTLRSVRQTRFA
jgi:phosphoribosyl 1,2-cyclic phosphodiesterase